MRFRMKCRDDEPKLSLNKFSDLTKDEFINSSQSIQDTGVSH